MIKNTNSLFTFFKSKDLLHITNFLKSNKFKKLPIIKNNNNNKGLPKVIKKNN
jgi:hypothetical protein